VLLNYGIDELRFTKPVYPGSEIYVRFTCKEKTSQEKKEPGDIDRGIVKWLVEIMDETEEMVGVATILTMVARKV
jgi:oxepin-CoA hydrolase/3-oxo-5,6-dehydrosuberyl-CoA semialdehyde dehydrogenase